MDTLREAPSVWFGLRVLWVEFRCGLDLIWSVWSWEDGAHSHTGGARIAGRQQRDHFSWTEIEWTYSREGAVCDTSAIESQFKFNSI